MKIKLSEKLIKLAEIFNEKATLYIVGGFLRNYFLGLSKESKDIDITSKLTPENVIDLLKNTEYEVFDVRKNSGCLKIGCGNESWEYSTFRRDNYENFSSPNVDYVEDIRQDAQRRDFTVNAIYFEILTGRIIDVYSGMLDLKKNTLRCVEVPAYVFNQDGFRILRMIRFACELNMQIDSTTLLSAKKMASQCLFWRVM